MISFKAALINELLRLCRRNKLIVLTIIDILICIIYLTITKLTSLTELNMVFVNMSTNILSFFTNFILPIYVAIFTIECFSSQYNDKTIVTLLCRPITRFKIYLSKITTISIFTLVHIMIVLITTLILNFSFNVHIFKLIISYFISIYPLIALACTIALIAQLTKNGLFGMLFSLIFLIGTKVLQVLFIFPSAFLFTTYLDWYKIFLKATPSFIHILTSFSLITAYAVFTFILGYLIFNKKEF